MEHINQKEDDSWIRPWNQEKFDDLYNRDERYFAVITKGFISWMTRNIVLYNKPIKHFIFNTGSSYMYMENTGYEFSWNETSGEDYIYHELPRCLVSMEGINVPFEELTSPYARGNYERRSGNDIKGYNAQIRRMPIECSFNLKYYLANYNEAIVLAQELIDKCAFQRYFSVAYLGNVIKCSIEFPADINIQINQIDLAGGETNMKTIEFQIKVCATYPQIIENTEITVDHVIVTERHNIDLFQTNNLKNTTDVVTKEYDASNITEE